MVFGLQQFDREQRKLSPKAGCSFSSTSKEFVNCVSDTLYEILHCEETAHAPLGVASPQTVESVEELEEELPAVTDCKSLALVDAAQSNPASLFENQDGGVEPRDCHEGACSAAPVAKNEFSLNSAITNQTPELVEQGYSATLLVENSVPGGEVKTVDEGESSAASVSSA